MTGWWLSHLPLWKMMEFVSWDDDMPFPISLKSQSKFHGSNGSKPATSSLQQKFTTYFPMDFSQSTEFPRRKPIRSNKIRNSALLDVTSYLLTGKSEENDWSSEAIWRVDPQKPSGYD